MKLFSTAIPAFRYFSTQTTSKNTKLTQSSFKNKNKYKRNDPTKPRRTRIKWTDQQSQVLDAISSGKSVFVTGSAGTGKTFLVKQIIKLLNKMHGPSRVSVTASTGVAACALKGQTLHSFAGIGLAQSDQQSLLHRVISNKRAYWRWNRLKALVIDEISMVDAEFFDKLEYIARKARDEQYGSENKVWGGIQLVVSGDFFQLPPILNQQKSQGKEFAFEADCWNSSFDMQVDLTTIFRQSDAQLIKLLQGIRRGESDPADLQLLEQRCLERKPDSSVLWLYPMNKDVNRVNKKQLESLNDSIFVYHAHDSGEDPWKRQLKQGIAPDELHLCVGARVMLSKNVNPWRKLVNGSTGTVVDFFYPNDMVDVMDICKHAALPVVKFDSGPELVIDPDTWVIMEGEKAVAERKQIPLILAWALSIHKCQGMTLDSLQTDLSRAFGCGMVYVALSRVRSLDGLHLSGFDPSKIKAHPKVLQFYRSFAIEQDKQKEDDGTNKNKRSSRTLLDVSDTGRSLKGECW
ncbi:hypothetical protein F0562_011334 [Nyssa sinensis]|uniref:ATP-dependent DNA helicase n=1 Tax=Nyssa sinensis TaxID=561372 RepID=A0A5J5A520_9ASTE|nr:hypothetical protein F0562_011334 [Nyssa sinensis]